MKTNQTARTVVALSLAALLVAPSAHAGVVTGLAVTEAILGPTVASCAASIGPQAVFTGLACATGWVAMGVSWLLPF